MIKKKPFYLQYLVGQNYGIGLKTGKLLLKNIGLNLKSNVPSLKIKHLDEINKKMYPLVYGRKLKDKIKNNIEFLIKNKTYKGIRHKFKYPTRGQRTHTNAKTTRKFKILKTIKSKTKKAIRPVKKKI